NQHTNIHTQTHTQAQDHYLALPILTSTRTLYIFFCTIHTTSTRPLHSFTLGQTLFLYLETRCVKMFSLSVCTVYMFSLCVCICDLCMYVGEVYKCISVFVYVYKLLDDLNRSIQLQITTLVCDDF